MTNAKNRTGGLRPIMLGGALLAVGCTGANPDYMRTLNFDGGGGGGGGGMTAPDLAVSPRDLATGFPFGADLAMLPSKCADIRAANPGARDGEYTLYVGRDPAKKWTVFCRDMAGAPKEYLSLPQGPGSNYSQYTAGGAAPGTSVRSSYSKVRIDPASLLVDISDQTYASSSGSLRHSGMVTVRSMPYAVAMDCQQFGAATGVGLIDLQRTPFAVRADAFVLGGANPSGRAMYQIGNQLVTLAGGGYCGWISPKPGVYSPFNDAGGFVLPLVYP